MLTPPGGRRGSTSVSCWSSSSVFEEPLPVVFVVAALPVVAAALSVPDAAADVFDGCESVNVAVGFAESPEPICR